MTTLRIEHAITDFAVWREAFDRFAEARTRAGVRRHRIHRPHDDDAYVCIDLDFDGSDAAERFLAFLKKDVWAVPESSPALAGTPLTRVLDLAEQS